MGMHLVTFRQSAVYMRKKRRSLQSVNALVSFYPTCVLVGQVYKKVKFKRKIITHETVVTELTLSHRNAIQGL